MNNFFHPFFDTAVGSSEIVQVYPVDDQEDDMPLQTGDIIPVLPVKNMVLFPGALLPVIVTRPKSLQLARKVHENETYIGVCTQKDKQVEDPAFDQLYPTGAVARIVRILEMPDGTTTIILEGKKRCILGEQISAKPHLIAKIILLEDLMPNEDKISEFLALTASIKDLATGIMSKTGNVPQEMIFAIRNIDSPQFLVNYVCANFGFLLAEKIELIEIDELMKRAFKLHELLSREEQQLNLKISIQHKALEGIDREQREYFLQQQMKTIRKELGAESPENDQNNLKKRAENKKWNEATAKIFDKELKKLDRINMHSPDYATQLNYLETLLDLPWNEYTEDNFNLKNARTVLDEDHFGLDTVKDRIIEHLAVLKLKGDLKAPIICLHGPPGTGKTSLGKSIARALNRKYVRMSLGGLHDEAEIRGHRRTYIGALPGRIVQNIIKAESANPVFVLDEIDKVMADYKGDPTSALLEVLDPEQNTTFHDNFLDIDFDLSKTLFVATANNLQSIPLPLLDRMEMIEVSGYTQEEKIEIAQKHLIIKELENHGLNSENFVLSKNILEEIIESYTRESGVRELNRKIASLMRKIAKFVASEEPYNKSINSQDLFKLLGAPPFSRDKYQGNDYAGVVTGLAWTRVGGDIMFLEASLSRSKQPKLTLTGSLGEVMKESAMLALEYVKAHADKIGIDPVMFEKWNVHIHAPEGAVPKDGPSAGITMATSLASIFTKRKIRKNLAMTGEIALRGKVLPVGGIKEKILAAKRAGITDVILCAENKKDVDEIKPEYLKGLEFHYVNDVMEVLNFALLDEKAE